MRILLAEITGRADFREVVEKTLASSAETMNKSPYVMPWMMSVADMQLGQYSRLVITPGERRAALIKAQFQVFCPRLICMGGGGQVDAWNSRLLAVDGKSAAYKSAAYYCMDETCQEAVDSAKSLIELLTN